MDAWEAQNEVQVLKPCWPRRGAKETKVREKGDVRESEKEMDGTEGIWERCEGDGAAENEGWL